MGKIMKEGIQYGVGGTHAYTGADVFTTSHTIGFAKAVREGKLYVANLTFTVGSQVSAWTTLGTLKNVSIGASCYFPAYTGGSSFVMLYVGTNGQISAISTLSANTEVKVAISLITE